VQWDKYLVQQGDTLTSISSKYMIDYELLKEINDLDENLIYENEELIVPRGPSWIKDYLNRPDVYYVSAGDSMWSIAKNFNVTIRDLSIWNDLNPSNYLLTGTKILIYPKYLKPKRIIKTNKTDIAYPIKKGDTISKIAIKFGIDKDWIIKWNAIENEALIYPGEIIKLNLSELN
jgi:membrane-bound lytic murein transglycosylase D